jgi:hypothetical protein
MQTSISVKNIQPNFRAKVAKSFIEDAHKLFKDKHTRKPMNVSFDEKVVEFENFGYDEYSIKYLKKDIDGKRYHKLIAVRSGMDDSEGTILTIKDQFRKVVEKFTHINKYEFTKKMEQNNQKKFFKIRPE